MNNNKLIFLIASFCVLALGSANTLNAAVYVKKAPPTRRVAVKPKKPSKNVVWVSGHWCVKRGNYVWVNGRWQKERLGYRWIDGHWEKTPRGWIWINGRWAK
jgi:hypothetical protein